MQQKKIIKELQEIVGKDKVITDEESIALASRDYIGFRRYHRSDGKNWAPQLCASLNLKIQMKYQKFCPSLMKIILM